MRVYEYPYERPKFEPGPASVFLVTGGLVDILSVGRDNLATFWRGGLTEAGNTLIEAVFSFEEIYGLEISFTHRKIVITTNEPLSDESKAKLNRLIDLLNNLQAWAFVADSKTLIG